MSKDNLAVLPFAGGPETKDKDGDDGGEAGPTQVIIDSVENGFVLNIHGEDEVSKVYLFNGKGDDGPAAMVQQIIDSLGLRDKVKLNR